MNEINDPTSSDQLCGTNCTAGLDFDYSTGDEWDQLKIVAIVIPIVILLLTIVIFAIYCFKKKADKAEKANQEINDRLPVIGAQDSTRSNGKRRSIIPSLSKAYKDYSLKNNEYNEITIGPTPGTKTAIEQNPSIMYRSQKLLKTNEPLDGINLEGSYTNSGYFSQARGQPNRSFNYGSETYNNSTIGYNNSSTGYNNTQPSLGYSNAVYDPKFGYQLGGTNCTAAVTNFERSSECYSDSSLDCEPEPGHSTCSVSE